MVWIGAIYLNAEVALLNHILKKKDMISPLNSDIEKSLILYREEWDFIKEYYTDYREVPPEEIFFAKFPNFDKVETEGAIEFYIEETHKWKARQSLQELLASSASALREVGPFNVIKEMNAQLAKLGKDTKMIRDLDLVSGAEDRIETLRSRIELRASGRETLGIPTGIQKIDKAFGGIMKSDFVVIAGWTGSLKSWLALYMALNAWKNGYRVLYFSLEMSGEQLGYRMDTLLGEGQFSHSGLTFGTEDITYDHYKKWLGDIMRDRHPFVVVSNEDLDEVTQNTVRAKIDQWKPDLVVLDYIALFDDASGIQGETEKIKSLSKAFKRIAIKTTVPVICITGVTQDKKDLGEKPPELADLAWSKQLAYDSDLTIAVCKHDETLEFISRKQRRGREFHGFLNWDIDRGIVKEMGTNNTLVRTVNTDGDQTELDNG